MNIRKILFVSLEKLEIIEKFVIFWLLGILEICCSENINYGSYLGLNLN
jgi:hypothetical protein